MRWSVMGDMASEMMKWKNNIQKKSKYPNNIEEFGDKFVNPYNFISLGKEVKRREKGKEDFSDELLTGSISCTLRTKTPIFIPNITNDNALGLADLINEKKDEQDNKADGNKETNEKHKNYDFFSYNDLSGKVSLNEPKEPLIPGSSIRGVMSEKISLNNLKEPIIPGSSIRGVIRSAFEALTDSCMMTSDNPLTARESKAKKAGILVKEKTGWKLYEANKYMIKTKECKNDPEPIHSIESGKYIKVGEDKYYTGDKIKFNVGKRYKDNNYYPYLAQDIGNGTEEEGILLLGEPFGSRKHHDSIFAYNLNNANRKRIEVQGDINEAIEKLELVLEVYKDPAVNRNLGEKNDEHNGYKHYSLNSIKEGMEYPVWYEKVGSTIYLAPACISRIGLNNTIMGILKNKNNGEFNSCSEASNLCPACELFGMVGDNSALGSKIRFSDAKLKKGFNESNCFDEIMTLEELSSPKPSAMEFYTERPKIELNGKKVNAHFWNYDYSRINKNTDINKELKILGRKFYWHSHSIKAQKLSERNNTESDLGITALNTTVRPVKAEVEFKFDIYFERITNKELESLIWVLTIGENNINGNRCHKIGGAKPLGFGSVKIVVNEVKNRTWNIAEDGSIIRTYKPMNFLEILSENSSFNDKAYREFLYITNYASMEGKNVQYTFGKIIDNNKSKKDKKSNNDEGSHVWFKLNRIAGDGATEVKQNIRFTLKGILEDPRLPQLQQDKNK
ncbi:TIGR03986 family CRISPR-associated RAMP protein [Ruminiclostridium herbifermentans]|uniref:TIGR03986 family CRISPR-associated RAMP protein n=1 Tax=Ruminiclostridium herbifermentans TaxID=2488810 RepID=A0A4U7JI08_9FIRM|nr:TIGR03986 family CRISPR-associated RAMP protein [Ruminiclostridium herbifermentans]QNU65522.1 TIGR03986 family CRISPR-associated RAMP protein [Ruminiclostridium herbifermentans]